MRRRRWLAGLLLTGATVGALAAPAWGTHRGPGASDEGSCVAWFVANLPNELRGVVISTGAREVFHPFGQLAVSEQARSARDACIHFPVP